MEVSILQHSEVANENVTFRIDAEYFRKEYRDALSLVEKAQFSYVEMLTSWVTQGPNPKFSEQGFPCLTGRNINKGEVSYDNSDYVDKNEYEKLSRFALKAGDTLITLKGKGSIGKIGYVTQDRPAIFSRDVGIVRPSSINPGYLNIFILCKYGKLLVDRGETGGTGQSTLTTSYLKTMPVPRFGIEEDIGDLLDKVEHFRSKSKKANCEAETILLSELGLLNWKAKHRLSFVKQYSETEQPGRIDAEYFHPKYEEIVNAIKLCATGYDTLGNLVEVKKCVEVGSGEYLDEGIPFVRVSNLSPFELSEEKLISEELYASLTLKESNDVSFEKLKDHQPQQGEILFSKDGSPGIAYYLKDKPAKMIPSGGILRLKSKTNRVNNEYLTLVLNAITTQQQMKRDAGGSIILHWRPEQVKETLIPILSEEKQTEIRQKVTESFKLRKQSKHLLECAKRAVEIAIEQDEETAIKWLEEEIAANE